MEDDKKIEIYLKGYEEGKKEAWSNIKSIVNRHEGWELKTRIESKLGTLYQDIESKRVELRDEPGKLSFVDEIEEGTDRSGDKEEREEEEPSIFERLGSGYSCLIIESEPEKGLDELKKADGSGNECLCITRTFPDKLINRYGLSEDISYIQLSKSDYDSDTKNGLSVETNSPGNLSSLSSKIGVFFKKNDHGVVFLTGLPYLFSYNDFNTILKFLSWTKEKVHGNNGNLILSLPRSGFKEDYLLKLKGEFEEVIEID